MPPRKKRTLEEFIEISNNIHNNKYSYDNTIYINNLSGVIITCSIHGDFEQLPKCHLRGNGCPKCSYIDSANKKIQKSKEKFFNEIKTIDYENRWDYSIAEEEFDGTNNDITIICRGCNKKTKRTPYKHLSQFQPCKKNCFNIRNQHFELKDKKEPIMNEINIIEIEIQEEEWKNYPLNEHYSVSNMGKIKNNKTGKITIGSLDKITGYMRTGINKKAKGLHQIVAETFLENTDNKPTVNHKNKNRTDNRLINLEWATYAENNSHKNENSVKTYYNHKNGRTVLRINKENNEVIETYETIILASKWILENIYKQDTKNKDIEKELRTLSSSLSQKIKRNQNNYFGYNFLWKFEEDTQNYENEIWKPITNFEKKGYYISNFGRIKTPNNKIKDKFAISSGYYELKISKSERDKIHRLVALHFIENIDNKPFVNHKNGNKLDNRDENLEWATNQENVIHAYENGLNARASQVIQYDKEGKNIINEFKTIIEASHVLNIGQSHISSCCRGIILQTHGFHFKYKEKKDEKIREKKQNLTSGKKVYQYDKNNNLLKSFNTIIECAKFYNVTTNVISNKLKGNLSKSEELNKYIFKFD
jgi:hypothetical protein